MLELIKKLIWGITTIVLIGNGLYFSYRLKCPQFRISKMIKSIKKSGSLKTLNLTLAAKIGVGSLAGTALSIYIGGLGTIFWMWISAFICATNTYCETYLAVINKKSDKDNNYYGGPSYYINDMLHNKKLAIIYAVLLILAYVVGFLTIQVNTISKVLTQYININPIIFGIITSLITLPIIFGGINKISDMCNKIVPLMTIFYLLISLFIVIINFKESVEIIANIIKSAFHLKPFLAGFISTFLIGIQRGIFSNESGIGTSAITSATTKDKKPYNQCYIQILGVYIATLFICTITAIVILLSKYNNMIILDPNGIELTEYAFKYHLGNFGTITLIITIILFSYSTIITGYYYGETNLKYIFNNNISIILLKIITLVLLILGSIISSSIIWSIVDIFVALLAIINIYSIFKLRKYIKTE